MPKAFGEMAEWSIAAVLKTVEGHTSGGSNPSLSAESCKSPTYSFFAYKKERNYFGSSRIFGAFVKTGRLKC